MSTDPFIADLQADWRASSPDDDRMAEKVSRHRRERAVWRWGEIVGALVSLVFGLWFALLAWRQLDWAYGLASAALLAATPLIVASLVRGRRAVKAAAVRTPFSTIVEARHHAEATIKAMRRARWAAWLLVTASAVGGALAAAGLADGLAWPILVWLSTALAGVVGTRFREGQMRRLLERCDLLLLEWGSADEAGELEVRRPRGQGMP